MKIPRRIAQTLINSLKAGVVPRVGLPYVTVGRAAEIDALVRAELMGKNAAEAPAMEAEEDIDEFDDLPLLGADDE